MRKVQLKKLIFMKAYFLSSPQTDPQVQCVINDYCAGFRKKTDEELHAIVDRERKGRGWTARRSWFLFALRQVCSERNIGFCWSDCEV